MTTAAETLQAPDPVVVAVHQAHLETPKGTQGVFDLPCGYLDQDGTLHKEVHLHEITGVQEDMLGSGAVPSHKKVTKLIEGCITKLGTLSPADLKDLGEKLLVGDRVFLMFALRRVSLGDAYPFRGRCPNEKCKYTGLFTLNLGDLDIRPMPFPLQRIYTTKLPSGLEIRWRPMIGRDEEELGKVRGKESGRSLGMFLRTVSVNGDPPTIQLIQNLGLRDRNAYFDEFEKYEGGVETTMEMQCPICSHEWDEELDVGQVGFFFPSSAQKLSKRRSST